ncbi:unnamed protein product [Lactuca virosa]|uniref:Secreted protein n=1 Tax=Lactuca virosa TaxID=75947 RepID=A0AAU9MWQ6_9ASTR|nr:unnamed protein product [Lactuca virosa]
MDSFVRGLLNVILVLLPTLTRPGTLPHPFSVDIATAKDSPNPPLHPFFLLISSSLCSFYYGRFNACDGFGDAAGIGHVDVPMWRRCRAVASVQRRSLGLYGSFRYDDTFIVSSNYRHQVKLSHKLSITLFLRVLFIYQSPPHTN